MAMYLKSSDPLIYVYASLILLDMLPPQIDLRHRNTRGARLEHGATVIAP